jgi:hypothetical protein
LVKNCARIGRQIVLDGEIAAPDACGVTHLDDLAAAMQRRDTAALAFFAFDILHLDGRDLRRCTLIERKAILAELLRSVAPQSLCDGYRRESAGQCLPGNTARVINGFKNIIKTNKIIHIRCRWAGAGFAPDDRLPRHQHRAYNVVVCSRASRPGGIFLGKQIERFVADNQRRIGAQFVRISSNEADDIPRFIDGVVRHQ